MSIKRLAKNIVPSSIYAPLQKKWQSLGERSKERSIARDASACRDTAHDMRALTDKLYASARSTESAFGLDIPRDITSLRLDVGLSYTAPNSALWIKNDPRTFVFGFEPNPEALDFIFTGKADRNKLRTLVAPSLRKVGGVDWAQSLGKNMLVFGLAVDDAKPDMKRFNVTDGVGTSSFLRPLRYRTAKQISVPTVRLSDFLSHIPWDRFKRIDALKVDTQGNDIAVIRSAGEYLKRIVFVIAEIPLEAEYEGAYTEAELDAFMESNGFEVVEGDDKNKVYGNAGFKDMWKTVDPATIKE